MQVEVRVIRISFGVAGQTWCALLPTKVPGQVVAIVVFFS
jgi:putative effector of murein hydrolase LrgA (UPF0299 family)